MLNLQCSIEHSTLNIEHYGCSRFTGIENAPGSCSNSKRIEIAIKACEVASIFFPAEHRITQQFPHTREFFPATFPTRIADRQIEKLQCADERLLAQLRIFFLPSMSTGDITADIGQLCCKRQRLPTSCG